MPAQSWHPVAPSRSQTLLRSKSSLTAVTAHTLSVQNGLAAVGEPCQNPSPLPNTPEDSLPLLESQRSTSPDLRKRLEGTNEASSKHRVPLLGGNPGGHLPSRARRHVMGLLAGLRTRSCI